MFQTTNQKITMSPCLSEPSKVAHQGDLQATPLKKEIQANISATYTRNLGILECLVFFSEEHMVEHESILIDIHGN